MRKNIEISKELLNDIINDFYSYFEDGFAFESFLKLYLEKIGLDEVLVTKRSDDGGIDLTAVRKGIGEFNQADTDKYYVQAKRYNKTVGIRSVQEILGAKKHYNADQCVVVTNNYFTFEAETLAKENGVRLIDRKELIELYKEVQSKLKISNQDSDLVAKENLDITEKFPFMI